MKQQIFHPIHLCHTLSFTLSPPLCYSLKITNYEMREKVFVYMAASVYHVISKDVENPIFRHTCMYKQIILIK